MNLLARFIRRPSPGIAIAVACVIAVVAPVVGVTTQATAAGAPTLSAISPAIGPFAGGTAVTLTGTGFVAGATVTFDGIPATGVTAASATQITATTPAGTPGRPVIVVRNPDGQGATLTNGFTYLGNPPVLAGVAPANGTTNGGDTITLTGSDFTAGMTVTVGGVAATNVVVQSAVQATARTPAGTGGAPVDVVVTNTDTQTSTLAGAFTYVTAAPPTITSVSPASGTHAGTTAVTITGTGFASGASVRFGGNAATSVNVVNATTITAVAPSGAAGNSVAVTVTNPDSQPGQLVNGYAYVNTPAPTVTRVTPDRAPLAGGVSVTIIGTGFVTGATVKFGANAATVSSVSATSITATAPAGTSTVGVTVTNPDNDTATLPSAFKYVPAPTIKSVSPAKVSKEGGDTITISGTGFESGATVMVGGSPATAVKVVSASQITAKAPSGFAGSKTVEVTNADNQKGTLSAAVQYLTPPVVKSITPGTGSIKGGTEVTITGSGFSEGMVIKFGEAKASSVKYVSSTKITAAAPAGKEGTVSVTAADKDGLTTSSSVKFTYDAVDATPTPTPTATPAPSDRPHFSLGAVPAKGVGLVAFSGGENDDLIAAAAEAGCPRVAQAFFVPVNGRFIVFLPAAPAIVNAQWNDHFKGTLPVDLTLAMRCDAR